MFDALGKLPNRNEGYTAGTRKTLACNFFQIRKKEWCRRGESNDTRLLILRNLLQTYERKNRKTRCMPASYVQNHVQKFEGPTIPSNPPCRRSALASSREVRPRWALRPPQPKPGRRLFSYLCLTKTPSGPRRIVFRQTSVLGF